MTAKQERAKNSTGLMEHEEALSPPLKWVGGKRWQVPLIEPLWRPHAHRRFVEPFCGGLAMTLGLRPERAWLNDINPHLMGFYAALQAGLQITIPMENNEALYYQHRDRFNAMIREGKAWWSDEAASLFYFLNKTGFNGLCRFNSKGGYNVPFGKYKTINYRRDFSPYTAAFAGWFFQVGDFDRVALQRDDFVYADPPYDVEFTQYSQGGFSWDDQVRTAKRLAEHSGPVVLVNQETPRIVSLYKGLGYTLKTLDAPRRVSCTGDRTPAKEILATRNL